MGFAEADALVDDLGGAGDDEQRLAVLLELGVLVGLPASSMASGCRSNCPCTRASNSRLGSYKPIQTT